MRTSLLAAASLIAVAYAVPANAEDCGCRDQVRAALSRQAPVAAQRPAVRRAAPVQAASGGYAEAGYDYHAARTVDMYPYRHRWEAAPQGYVPPPQGYGYAPPMEEYGAYAPPMPYGPPTGVAMNYANPAYPDGWAYSYQRPGIEIDQRGWFGGVGYPNGGDGGGDEGGGGGGGVITLAQPDGLNGPSYNSFGQSYGGAYGAANQLNAWRADAFAPKASK